MTRIRIESFAYPGLGNSSHLVVDENAGVAAVIDPQRDVDQYVEAAARLGARITHTFETHVHNDFVSGGRELAARHGATLVASAAAGLEHPFRPVWADDVVEVVGLRFRVLATPGHTPEHVAFLLEVAGEPPTLFSGGALMVGTIARSDLLGHEHAPGLARQAHHTLHQVLLPLPTETRVLPTHGAGSFCAGGASGERETTIADERRRNRFAFLLDQQAFVREALSDLPRYPTYFARMRGLNQQGAPLLDELPRIPPLEPTEVSRRLADDGAILVDTRPPRVYDAAHVPGSLAVALEPSFSQWIGWLVPPDRSLLFVLDDESCRERVARELVRIGYDSLDGHLRGGIEAWRAAGFPTARTTLVDPSALEAPGNGVPPTVLDVRWDEEWAQGHIPGALHIPLPDLPSRVAEVPRGRPVAVHCAHTFRSGMAVSLLERAGFPAPILHLDGGFAGWRKAGRPVETGAEMAPTPTGV